MVVTDVLHECSQNEVSVNILHAFVTLLADLPFLKIVITGRPEGHLCLPLDDQGCVLQYDMEQSLSAHDVENILALFWRESADST